MECIRYLKEQRIGVATFLPLDTIQGKSVDDKYALIFAFRSDDAWAHPINSTSFPRFFFFSLRSLAAKFSAKPIIDVLKYDQMYHKVMEYVCGNTLVCDSLDAARKLAFKQTKRYKGPAHPSQPLLPVAHPISLISAVVTMDGTLIQKSGLMTGGISGVEAKSARWDEKEIESTSRSNKWAFGDLHLWCADVKQRRDKLVAELTELSSASRSIAKEQQLSSQIAALESKLKFTKYDQDMTKERVQKNTAELKKVESDLSKVKTEMDKVRVKKKDFTPRHSNQHPFLRSPPAPIS